MLPNRTSQAPQFEAAPNLHSCVLCRKRKVKCDKRQPCYNCIKAHAVCNYSLPAPPRRRKGRERLAEEDLRNRLRRYEELLQSYGAKIDDRNGGDESTRPSDDLFITPTPEATGQVQPPPQVETLSIQNISHEISLHNLWTTLSDEILDGFSEDEANYDDGLANSLEDLVSIETGAFTFDPRSSDSSLTHLHPPTIQIFRLWQVFLSNVNPLVKVIHAPMVQQQILESSVNIENVSRPVESFMFAIYSCAITSLSAEECEKLTGEPRELLRPKYHKAAQQALIRAGLFKTLDIQVLQAAVLFLVSIRLDYDPGEFWILAGVVLRIGQRIGLHRDSFPPNLSVVDVEIRRRLWWQIRVLNARGAERSGVGASPVDGMWESPLPLNVNDSDLSPDMKVAPLNHVGATEMTFVLMMYETGIFLRRSASMAPFDGSWQKVSSHTVPFAEKDKVIDELEGIIQQKFLKFCDPVIPLYQLAIGMANMVIGRMRLTTRHPRQFPDRGLSMSHEDKQKLFAICMMMIEQENLLRSTASVRGFLWHVDLHFQLDAFVYLLSELQLQCTGSMADKAWSLIAETFLHHPHIITNTKTPLYMAIGSLTLKSWKAREAAFWITHSNPPEGSPPLFISTLRFQRAENIPSQPSTEHLVHDPHPIGTNCQNADTSLEFIDGNFNDSSILTDGNLTMEMSPVDWNYWDDLIQGAEVSTINYDV